MGEKYSRQYKVNVSAVDNKSFESVSFIKKLDIPKKYNPMIDDVIKNLTENESVLDPYICDRWDATFAIDNAYYLNRESIKESLESIMQYFLQQMGQQVNAYPPEELVKIFNDLMGAEFVIGYRSEGVKKALGVDYKDGTFSPFHMIINFDEPMILETGRQPQ